MKTAQFRVRLNEDNSDALRQLAADSGSSPIEIATMLLHSSLVAIRSKPHKVKFPFRFEVEETSILTTKPKK
jgi:hypothetical protein